MTYDPKCYELAKQFLPDDPESARVMLAEAIQATIEDFLQAYKGDQND